MSDKLHRRNFIGRLTLGVSSLLALPAILKSKEIEDMSNAASNAIIRVRPLGFQWQTLDPFLFCVHHEDKYPNGNAELGPDASLAGRQIGQDFVIKDGWRMYHGDVVPGFPGHPHRGFETITVVREGLVDHADSMGASGRYGNGDVQWMTAGKGIQHSEMFPLLSQEHDNPMELFQIWLNLPAQKKMVEPHFKMLWAEAIPHYKTKDSAGKSIEVEIIAGKLDDNQADTPPPNSWAHSDENRVAIWNIDMEANSTWTIPAEVAGLNRTLYYYIGEGLSVNGRDIESYHAVDVNSNSDLIIQAGNTRTKILMLQGKPIGQPVVQHGPFVMNTKAEIQQAFADYQKDQFGGWPWPRRDQVHEQSLGRFAKHSDGKVENKG